MRKLLPYEIITVAGLLLLSFAGRANIGGVNTNNRVWGKSAGDFQMTASLDGSNGVLHCWVRNSGTNDIAYNDFEFGYTENVRLEIHQGAKWIRVYSEIVPWAGNIVTGVIHLDTKVVQPGQIITNTWEWRDTLSREPALARRKKYEHDELVRACHGNTNFVARAEQVFAQQASLSGVCQGDTFALDLINTRWPTNMLHRGSFEMRVRQDLPYPFIRGKLAALYSPVITVNSFVIQQFLKRRHWGN